MTTNTEKRNHERIHLEAPIMFSQYTEKRYCYYGAYMYNYSQNGFYFESCYPLQRGKLISIRKANYSPESRGNSTYTEYRAVVQWCNEKVSSNKLWYGAGVKCFEPIVEPPFAAGP